MALLSVLSLLVVLYVVYQQVSRILFKRLLRLQTATADLPLLGKPRKNKFAGNAVVCGGSFAGIFSARVLADHFENVLIIEAEEWVTSAEGARYDPSRKRAGVSQYTFLHGFQAFLGLALHGMFGDSFEEELNKGGGRYAADPHNLYFNGRDYPAQRVSPRQIFCTRGLLETTLRRLLLRTCKNVRYVHGTAIGLVRKAPTGPIDGVRVKQGNSDNATVIPSVFVADCTGSASAGLQWLKALEPKKVQSLDDLKTSYAHKSIYTFCEIDVPEHLHHKIKTGERSQEPSDDPLLGINYWLPDAQRERRAFGFLRQDNNILHLALGAWGTPVSEAPETLAQLRDIVSSLSLATPVPQWALDVLELFEKEEVPYKFATRRLPPSTYIQYHLGKDLPSNFVALGDAIHQSNPMRGLGTMKTSIDATTLNGVLARCNGAVLPSDFGRRFFTLQASRSGGIWASSKIEDYAWDTTIPAKGEKLSDGQIFRSYSKYCIRLASKDPGVYTLLANIGGAALPPLLVFSPSVVVKVFWTWMETKLGYAM